MTSLGRRRLGRTELVVTEIGLGGAWLLGRDGDRPLVDGVAVVHRALELGINYLDTAECYIGGRSEAVLGLALASRPAREPAPHVATKFGHVPAGFDFRADSVLRSLERSLEALGLPAVDVLQLHTPAEPPWEAVFGPGGALEGMRRAREAGLARFLGVTGRDLSFLVAAVATGHFDTVLVFQRFNALEQTAEALLAAAREHDVGVIVGSPLGMGLLGSARDRMLPQVPRRVQRQVQALEALAAEAGLSLPELATRFVLAEPAVACCLCGAATPAEVEASVAAASKGPLPPELVERVRALAGAAPA